MHLEYPAHVTDVRHSFEACRLEFLEDDHLDDHLAAFIDRERTHFITH